MLIHPQLVARWSASSPARYFITTKPPVKLGKQPVTLLTTWGHSSGYFWIYNHGYTICVISQLVGIVTMVNQLFTKLGPPPVVRPDPRSGGCGLSTLNPGEVFTTGVWSYEANVQQLMLGAPLEIAMSVAAWHCVAQLKPKEGWLNPIESPNPVKTLQCQTWLAGKSPNSTLRWKKLGRSSNGRCASKQCLIGGG